MVDKNIEIARFQSCKYNKNNYILSVKINYSETTYAIVNWNYIHSDILCELVDWEFTADEEGMETRCSYIEYENKKWYYEEINELIDEILLTYDKKEKGNELKIHYKSRDVLLNTSTWIKYPIINNVSLIDDELKRITIWER